MPIDRSAIESEVANLISSNKEVEAEGAEKAFAQGLASIIENAIKSATVTVDAGIPVTTTGTAAAQTGQTSGPGSGSLS